MDNLDSLFKEQQRLEDEVSLKAMIVQVTINLGFAVSVLLLFSWLRPRHDLIYAPKAKLSKSDIRRPHMLGSGWFDWIKPVFKIKDDALLENIGFDAYIFIYFTRILRRLVIILTLISMFVFLPLNIVATYITGDWPPVGLEFMSISAMNYQYGKQSTAPNLKWYWAPTIASWLFSIIVTYQMIHASRQFMLFRQKYHDQREEMTQVKLACMSPSEMLQQQKQDLISRTLLVYYTNNKSTTIQQQKSLSKQIIRPNQDAQKWIDSLSTLSCQQVLMGKYNNKVALQIKDYNRIIKALEKVLNQYLYCLKQQQCLKQGLDYLSLFFFSLFASEHAVLIFIGTLDESTATVRRPQIRLNWRSKNVDAINYYTERALILNASIKRNRLKLQDNNYGWAIYPDKNIAQNAYLSIKKNLSFNTTMTDDNIKASSIIESIRFAPHPNDIVWSNMNVEKNTAQLKRWFGYGLFCSVIFAWSIPVATLAVTSNLINFIRLFPRTGNILQENQLLMGIIQSYLTPCMMVLFYFGLPGLARYISRQQAYKTETVLQQKILSKLYAFFVINNLFIFTSVSIMIGIVGQITALTLVGTLKSKSLSEYVVQIAKNMTNVSSFWISYVCIRSVGILVDLLQVMPLLGILVFREKSCFFFRYTPRQLDKVIGAPPFFDFATNFAVIISFFTAALVYSVTAPIVLPFVLIYFGLATTTYKYKLMYINVTEVETHGRVWPMLYCVVMISLLVFQLMMILIFGLKSGKMQIYSLIPLPIMTTVILVLYTRHLYKHNTLEMWVELNHNNNATTSKIIAPTNNNKSSRDSKMDSSIEMREITECNRNSSREREDPKMREDANLMNCIYKDPTLYDPLWKPMVFDEYRNLLVDVVYKEHSQRDRILNILYSSGGGIDNENDILKPKVIINKLTPTEDLNEVIPSSTTPMTTTPIQNDEKLQINLEMTIPLYPPISLHSPLHDTSFHHYYQEEQEEEYLQGSSGGGGYYPHVHFTTTAASFYGPPLTEEDHLLHHLSSPTAPPLESLLQASSSSVEKEVLLLAEEQHTAIIHQIPPPMVTIAAPPPNYADAVISPRVNELHQLGPSQQASPLITVVIKRRHST